MTESARLSARVVSSSSVLGSQADWARRTSSWWMNISPMFATESRSLNGDSSGGPDAILSSRSSQSLDWRPDAAPSRCSRPGTGSRYPARRPAGPPAPPGGRPGLGSSSPRRASARRARPRASFRPGLHVHAGPRSCLTLERAETYADSRTTTPADPNESCSSTDSGAAPTGTSKTAAVSRESPGSSSVIRLPAFTHALSSFS